MMHELRDIISDTAADLSNENMFWTAGDLADALIAAFEAEGLAIVPVEPTPAMIDAFVSAALQGSVAGHGGWSDYACAQWKRMIEAAKDKTP